jgi:hypothetical protein
MKSLKENNCQYINIYNIGYQIDKRHSGPTYISVRLNKSDTVIYVKIVVSVAKTTDILSATKDV